jgi:hypothetical protein
MKKAQQEIQEVIYRGVWEGIGKMYNVRVENGYTTIIVKRGEDVEQRSKEAKAKFTA